MSHCCHQCETALRSQCPYNGYNAVYNPRISNDLSFSQRYFKLTEKKSSISEISLTHNSQSESDESVEFIEQFDQNYQGNCN